MTRPTLAIVILLALLVAAPSAAPLPVRHPGASEQGQRGAPHEAAFDVVDGRAAADPDRPAGGAPLPALTYTGKLGYALPSHGSRYLAIRWPRGTVVQICGPAACLTRTSTDFGPVLSLWKAGRLADVSAADFPVLCGVPLRFGLCPGTLLIVSRPRALPETDTSIATSGFGMHGAPRLSMTATCRNSGHQAVWVAQTGTASLDIIQVGTMDGEFFYAYGRGVPNGPDSLYVEEHLGPSGTGPHRYGVALAAPRSAPVQPAQSGAPHTSVETHAGDTLGVVPEPAQGPTPRRGAPLSRVWTLTIDGRTVATVPDTFRRWRLRATQVMAEGDLPFGAASCSFPAGSWTYGGYGPQPPNSFSARSWRVL